MSQIDKEKLLEWLRLRSESYRTEEEFASTDGDYDLASYSQTNAIQVEDVIEEIESGTFDIQEPETDRITNGVFENAKIIKSTVTKCNFLGK